MAIFLALVGCSAFCVGAGLWMGYLWGFDACMHWLHKLTGVRIDKDGRVVRPKYAGVTADGRILKSREEVTVEPAEVKLVKLDDRWKLSESRQDSGPHG